MTRSRPKTPKTGSPLVNALLARLWFALLVHWVFQGVLQMDHGERFVKIATTVCLAIVVCFVMQPGIYGLALSIIVGHSINFLLFGQLNVVLKNFGISRANRSRLIAYLDSLEHRVRGQAAIRFAAVYGSLSRQELRDTSDLDVRFVRRPGPVNLLRACGFTFSERLRVGINGIPLDVLVLDSEAGLARLRADERAAQRVLKDAPLEGQQCD